MKKITLLLSLFILMSVPMTVKASELNEYGNEIEAIERQEDSLNKTLKINTKDLAIITTNDIDFSDKKITCIGDSITYGNGGSDDGYGNKISYCNFLSEELKCQVINLGIGGSAIGDYWDETSLIRRWEEIPQDSDIIIVFAGINDFFIGPDDYGSIDENNTFCHDSYCLLNNIKNNYPNADIFVVTTYKNQAENWEPFQTYDMKQYMDTLMTYADDLGLNIIDLYDSGFLNSQIPEIKKNYVPDDVHPNDNGNKILAERIASELILYYGGFDEEK